MRVLATEIHGIDLANLPFTDPAARENTVTIQVPRMSTISADANVIMNDSTTLLIAAPQVFNADHPAASNRSLYFAFTPRLLKTP